MNINEAARRVNVAIQAAFASQQNTERTDYVTVRMLEDPSIHGAFEAIIHAPNAADHLRARKVVLDALRGERVTFP